MNEIAFTPIIVTTSDHPFFIPAQKMYQACGFKELRRFDQSADCDGQTIEYELELQ